MNNYNGGRNIVVIHNFLRSICALTLFPRRSTTNTENIIPSILSNLSASPADYIPLSGLVTLASYHLRCLSYLITLSNMMHCVSELSGSPPGSSWIKKISWIVRMPETALQYLKGRFQVNKVAPDMFEVC